MRITRIVALATAWSLTNSLFALEGRDVRSVAQNFGALGADAPGKPSEVTHDEEIESLVRQLESAKMEERVTAARTLGEIGPAAAESVPGLIKSLESRDPGLRHEAVVALGRIASDARRSVPALTSILSDQLPIMRHSAIEAVRRFGSDAQDAVSELKTLLDDRETLIRICAARAIVEIQLGKGADVPLAMPVLIAALKSDHYDELSEAILGLAIIGSAAVDPIQELIAGSDLKVAVNACDALAAIGPGSASAVDRLLATVKSPDHKLRCRAIHALGEIGPAADKAVPSLISALGSSDAHMRFRAEHALHRIGKSAVPALNECLNQPDIQAVAARILGGIGPDANAAVPGLARLVESQDGNARREALLALASIGPDAKSAASTLTRVFGNKQFPNRAAAAFAIGKIGVKEAIPELKAAIDDAGNSVLRLASIWALLQLDPTNDDYVSLGVPILTASLRSELPDVRREAALALGRIGARAKTAVPELTLRLKDENPAVRRESLVALAEIGPDSAPAVGELLQVIESDETGLRTIGCYALGRIGAASKPAVPLLHRMLFSRDSHEKTVAAWALVNIEPDENTVKMAIPLLAAALRGAENPNIRVEAARTLGKIGRNSTIALDALRVAMKDYDESVRKAAEQAMNP